MIGDGESDRPEGGGIAQSIALVQLPETGNSPVIPRVVAQERSTSTSFHQHDTQVNPLRGDFDYREAVKGARFRAGEGRS